MPTIPIPPIRRHTATPFSARLHERAATVIAPAAVAATRDHVRIDGDYTATLALTGYPRQLIWGLVDRLAALGEPLMVSVHLAPQDHAHVGRVYAERLTALESSRLLAADHQRLPQPCPGHRRYHGHVGARRARRRPPLCRRRVRARAAPLRTRWSGVCGASRGRAVRPRC